jgi:hypothetical protein
LLGLAGQQQIAEMIHQINIGVDLSPEIRLFHLPAKFVGFLRWRVDGDVSGFT